MTFRPSTGTSASVTMPAGFVKLTSQASGQCVRISRANPSMAGMERSAYEMPPAPVVSWPSSPSSWATRSSATRPAVPPGLMAANTTSVPVSASRSDVVAVTAGGCPTAALPSGAERPGAVDGDVGMERSTAVMAARRPGSTSNSTSSRTSPA